MEELFSIDTTSHYSTYYKINTQVPSLIYKIRIDIAKTREKNIRVFVFKDLAWSLVMEEAWHYNKTTQNTGILSSQQMTSDIYGKKKMEYLDKIYKILCL